MCSSPFAVSQTALTTTEDGTTASFTVRLKTRSSSNVEVTFKSRDTTEGYVGSDSDTDGGWSTFDDAVTLTFTRDNWNVPQTVQVQGQDDSILDGNQTYEVAATWVWSMDLAYTKVAKPAISVTNTDTDAAGITLSETAVTTAENGSYTSFSVVLNLKPSAEVTVPVTLGDPSEGSLNYYS